jgi:hypothetical protein
LLAASYFASAVIPVVQIPMSHLFSSESLLTGEQLVTFQINLAFSYNKRRQQWSCQWPCERIIIPGI